MERELCINKFNSLLNDINTSTKIEESIYNYTLLNTEGKGIETNLNNKYFKRIYVNKIISLYNNLDINSYVQNFNFIKKI